jgi:hypothetical protein
MNNEEYTKMDVTADNVEAMSMKVSENGVAYKEISVPDFESEEAKTIKNENEISELPHKNIKLRVSIVNHRMAEDGETYEEYRYRQSIMNHRINKYLKGGTLVWNSAMLGTYNKQQMRELIKQNQK